MGAEPHLKAIILVSTRTYPGEEVLRQWCQYCLLARRRRSPPIDERLRELQKPIHIREFGRQTKRNAQGALLLVVDDLEELLIGHTLFLAKTGGQILPHKAEGNLAYPWIAKTPAAYREPTLVSFLLQSITIQQRTRRIVEIESNRPSAPLGADRTVDAHHRLTVAMAQREQIFQDPAGQTPDPLVNQFNPNRSQYSASRSPRLATTDN